MAKEEARMSRAIAADVIFVQRGSRYWAVPPRHKAHPFTKPGVSFYNLTGHLKDLLAVQSGLTLHPQIVAIEVKRSKGTRFIPMSAVVALIAPIILLNKNLVDIDDYQPSPDDLYLIRDVLDKQIIDTNGVRVVRVNDLELTRLEGNVYISNVDISSAGLLRRRGVSSLVRRRAKSTQQIPGTGPISWDHVELLSSDEPLRLKVPGEKITELHPADLAELRGVRVLVLPLPRRGGASRGR